MRLYSGKEPYVFSVSEPRELFGVHGDLIEAALLKGEEPRYLLYSPIWEDNKAHFGIRARPASHSIAVTQRRFIITRNYHAKGSEASTHSIPFENIFSVELGSALLLGWFCIKFAENGTEASLPILFPATTGLLHFGAAIRLYRESDTPAESPGEPVPGQDMLSGNTPALQAELLRLLMPKGERIYYLVRSAETWGRRKKWWKEIPVCTTTDSVLAMAEFGLIYTQDQPPLRPGMLCFGVNARCIPCGAVKSSISTRGNVFGRKLRVLRLRLERKSATAQRDLLFDECAKDSLELVHSFLNQHAPTWMELRLSSPDGIFS